MPGTLSCSFLQRPCEEIYRHHLVQLETKIGKANNQRLHLTKQIPEKPPHGGKRFRLRQISLREQLATTAKRLNDLQAIKRTTLQNCAPKAEKFWDEIYCHSNNYIERLELTRQDLETIKNGLQTHNGFLQLKIGKQKFSLFAKQIFDESAWKTLVQAVCATDDALNLSLYDQGEKLNAVPAAWHQKLLSLLDEKTILDLHKKIDSIFNQQQAELFKQTAKLHLYGPRPNFKEAAKSLRQAAELGDPLAQFNLGLMYHKGQVVQRVKKEVKYPFNLRLQAILQGKKGANKWKQKPRQLKANASIAMIWYEKAAEQGNARALFNLGRIAHREHGYPKHHPEAKKWHQIAMQRYRQAAELGLPQAQMNLGLIYQNGERVPQDYQEAAKWFQLAASQGSPNAMLCLGWLYRNGNGVPQDHQMALKWFRQAAELRNEQAQNFLGAAYEKGTGIQANIEEAEGWYRKAAKYDICEAQSNLSRILRLKRGYLGKNEYQRLVNEYEPRLEHVEYAERIENLL